MVPNAPSVIQYNGNGSGTSFAFPYIIYRATELTVIGVTLATGVAVTYVLNTDYTIDPTELGTSGGVNVVFGTACASGVQVTIARIVPLAQLLQLEEGADFPSATGERQLDEIVFMIQQLAAQIGGLVLPSISSPTPYRIRSQDLLVYDVSSGVTPQISITPGNYKDFTAGVDYIPTLNGTAITNSTPPILVISPSNTVVYAACTIDDTTGEFTGAPTILAGDTMPDDSETMAYDLISNILVTVGTTAIVKVLGGGVSSSRGYFYCGPLPAVDASGHLFNS